MSSAVPKNTRQPTRLVLDSLTMHSLYMVYPKVSKFYNELHTCLASCGLDRFKPLRLILDLATVTESLFYVVDTKISFCVWKFSSYVPISGWQAQVDVPRSLGHIHGSRQILPDLHISRWCPKCKNMFMFKVPLLEMLSHIMGSIYQMLEEMVP